MSELKLLDDHALDLCETFHNVGVIQAYTILYLVFLYSGVLVLYWVLKSLIL